MDDLGDAAGEPVAPVERADETIDDESVATPAAAMDAAPTPHGGGRSTPPPVAV
jgi:hypothetical protein